MSIVNTLTRRLRTTETYRCALCASEFDRERPNCPACGSVEIEARS